MSNMATMKLGMVRLNATVRHTQKSLVALTINYPITQVKDIWTVIRLELLVSPDAINVQNA